MTRHSIGQVTRPDGTVWDIVSATVTADGFIMGSGVLQDAEDEHGVPVIHDFLLGRISGDRRMIYLAGRSANA